MDVPICPYLCSHHTYALKNPVDIENVNLFNNFQMLSSNTTQDSGIHTMSSKKDSAFYDSSSLPYSSIMERKVNSDCFPCQNDYQHCVNTEQLKTRSCDNFPRYADVYNNKEKAVKNLDFYDYMNALENRKSICCDENSGLSYYCQNMQIPSDPGEGKHNFVASFFLIIRIQLFKNIHLFEK